MAQKILLIDDEINFLKSIAIGLKKYGLSVVTATNGNEGFIKFKNEEFDFVVCDINLPDTTGWEVASKIFHEYPDTNLIFITAAPTGKQRKHFKRQPILQKPFVLEELLNLIYMKNIQ